MTLDSTYSLVSATELGAMLEDGNEIALLDVREVGDFSRGHLWLANYLPLSGLELNIRRFVPRAQTRVVLCDQNDGIANRAAHTMASMGYTDLSILDGGIQGWLAAGNNLIDGNYVIAHAFGYFIEQIYQTPIITARQLMEKQAAGEDIVVIDARAESDYLTSSLPDAISVPAAEVARRIPDLVTNDDTQVVVHCAGITRAALGAQGVINCGIKNPVYSLRDGTRGWYLAGGELASDQSVRQPQPSPSAKAFCGFSRQQLCKKFDFNYISINKLTEWRAQNSDRTCYLIDVRSQEEFLDGHYPGAIWVPGGELVGMTIDHIATRNARLCLFADEDCTRAEITASWMFQQQWSDVVIVSDWKTGVTLATGQEPAYYPEIDEFSCPVISLDQLATDHGNSGIAVLEIGSSESYRKQHIPGAIWISRTQLPQHIEKLNKVTCVIVTSNDARLAKLAARDIVKNVQVPVKIFPGGTDAWLAAGFEIATGLEKIWGHIDDVEQNAMDSTIDNREEICHGHRQGIAWRNGLYPQHQQHRKHERSIDFAVPSFVRSG